MGSRIFFNPYIFTSYISATGNVQWVARQAGAGTDDYTTCMSVDSLNNLYLAGNYNGATIGMYHANTNLFGTTLALSGTYSNFLSKYNSLGAVQWVARQISTGSNFVNGCGADSNGNVYIAGQYNASTTAYHANGAAFGTTLGVVSGTESFLMKYNTAGAVSWVARQAGSGTNDGGYELSVGSDGSSYVTGQYFAALTAYHANNAAFGTTLAISTAYDCFTVKYDTNGVVQWVARQAGSGGSDFGRGISVDSNGNVYVCAQYNSNPLTVYHANTATFGTTLTNSGNTNSSLVKYNSSGAVQWAARIGGTGNHRIWSVKADQQTGDVYIAGDSGTTTMTAYHANTAAFGTTLTASSQDSFLIKYNSSGVVQWVSKQTGTGLQNDGAYYVNIDNSGYVYVAGYFASPTFIAYNSNGSQFGTTLSVSTATDSFLAKYDSNGNVQWLSKQAGTGSKDETSYIGIDSTGSVYIVGQYNSSPLTAFHSNGNSFGTTLAVSTAADGFIVKYS